MLSLHLEKIFFAVQTRLGGQGKHRYCVGVVESMTPIQKYTISPNFFLFRTSHVLSSFWKCTYMLLFSIVHGIHYDDVMYIQRRCGFWGKKNFNCAGHVSFLVGRAIIKDEYVFSTWVPFHLLLRCSTLVLTGPIQLRSRETREWSNVCIHYWPHHPSPAMLMYSLI